MLFFIKLTVLMFFYITIIIFNINVGFKVLIIPIILGIIIRTMGVLKNPWPNKIIA